MAKRKTARKAGRGGQRRAAKRASTARKQPARRKTAARVTRRAVAGRPAAKRPSRKTAVAKTARKARRPASLDRERRRLAEEKVVPMPPSSLDMDRSASAARSGRRELKERLDEHTETGPGLTGGDIDANWETAYSSGDEAPGGDNPTPGQDRVDDIGKSLGVEYDDAEELKASDKITQRDKHRWELDPASSEDYRARLKERK